jgi:putative dimethyl sulfoxide reductase chaperone
MCSTSETSNTAEVNRANAYYSLAAAFRSPREWHGEEPIAFEQHFNELGPELAGLGQKVAAQWRLALADLQACEVAYAKLFLGPYEILAPPYAAMYLDPERRLMGPVSQYALAAYAEAGLDQISEVREIPDHIIIELEFMYFLAFEGATSECGKYEQMQQKFWSEHFGKWLPRLGKNMAAAKVHGYYQELGKLLIEFASTESKLV